ncbi:hypothetical protein DVH05_000462 [Phytophthora capsici]|nr:hypothetical protein DVH05_012420 [Phytophthora capsici]KAG1712722.1 hypothetical protein DVH05_000462 [Phytophthora capsici]
MRFGFFLLAAIALFGLCESTVLNTQQKRNLRLSTTNDNEERAIGNISKVDDVADDASKNFAFMINMFKEWDELSQAQIIARMFKQTTPDEFAAMWIMYKVYQKLGADDLIKTLKAKAK